MLIDKNEFGESSIRRAHKSENPVRKNSSLEKEYRKKNLGCFQKVKMGWQPNQFGFFWVSLWQKTF